MESDATLRGMPLQWPGTEGHATSTVPSLTGPDVPIGCPGAPPAHLSICAHSHGATGSLARQEEGLDPGPKTQNPDPYPLPCLASFRVCRAHLANPTCPPHPLRMNLKL